MHHPIQRKIPVNTIDNYFPNSISTIAFEFIAHFVSLISSYSNHPIFE